MMQADDRRWRRDMSLTFEAARARHLGSLDADLAKLRAIAADPEWCNDIWPDYVKCRGRIDESLKAILRLNQVQMECEDKSP